MKIKSNLPFNTSLLSKHKPKETNAGGVVIGSGQPSYLKVPAGATIELDDSAWEEFNGPTAQGLIKAGKLTMLVKPAVSPEVQEESDVLLEASLREQMNGIVERRAAAEAAAEAEAAAAEANKS